MTRALLWGSLLWLLAMQVAVEILTPPDPDQVARAAEAEAARKYKQDREREAIEDEVARVAQVEYYRAEEARQLAASQAKEESRRLGRLRAARWRDPFQPYVEGMRICGGWESLDERTGMFASKGPHAPGDSGRHPVASPPVPSAGP